MHKLEMGWQAPYKGVVYQTEGTCLLRNASVGGIVMHCAIAQGIEVQQMMIQRKDVLGLKMKTALKVALSFCLQSVLSR